MGENDLIQPPYFSIRHLLQFIDEPNQVACRELLDENEPLFKLVQGSVHNHQAWPGGYFDHVQEIMNIAVKLYIMFKSLRPLPFSLSSLLLVVFLHDIEKPWKYEIGEDGRLQHRAEFSGKSDDHDFRMEKILAYGITLTDDELNGLKYAEGELHDYSNRERKMGSLAALVHMADVGSARLFPEYPLESNDPWAGAVRVCQG